MGRDLDLDDVVAQYPEAKRELEQLRDDLAAARARLPSSPLRESDCTTLENWRHRAMYLESQWAGCSYDCARIQTQRDNARTQLAAARALLLEARNIIGGAVQSPPLVMDIVCRIDAALAGERKS